MPLHFIKCTQSQKYFPAAKVKPFQALGAESSPSIPEPNEQALPVRWASPGLPSPLQKSQTSAFTEENSTMVWEEKKNNQPLLGQLQNPGKCTY